MAKNNRLKVAYVFNIERLMAKKFIYVIDLNIFKIATYESSYNCGLFYHAYSGNHKLQNCMVDTISCER